MAGEKERTSQMGPWATFKSWNADLEFWHTAYKDGVRATVVALVLYTLAAAGGLVTREPLIFLGFGLALLVAWGLGHELAEVRRAKRGVTHPSEGELRVMRSNVRWLGIWTFLNVCALAVIAYNAAQGNIH